MNWLELIIGSILGIIIAAVISKIWNFLFIREVRDKVLWFLAKTIKTHSLQTKSIKSNIETFLNEEIRLTNLRTFDSDILINDNIRIEWVRIEADESIFLSEGETIIRLGYDFDETRNYIEAIMRYLDNNFITATIPYIDSNLRTALKLEFIHQAMYDKGVKAFKYYNEHYLAHELSIKIIRDYMDKTNSIKQKGFFISIFLREINDLCNILALDRINRTNQLDKEIIDFMNFLFNIADKDNYESENRSEPPLSFIRNYFRLSIVLVKSKEKKDLSGHKNAINYAIQNGAVNVYIAGYGLNVENVTYVYKSGLSEYSNEYNLIPKGCVELEIEPYKGSKTYSRICLISRA